MILGVDKMKKKITIAILGIAISAVIITALALIASSNRSSDSVPTLKLETPQKVSLSDETVTLDLTVSSLGVALYPAASVSISFDPSKLEFLGIEEGNINVYDGNGKSKLPEWSCNTAQCNESGIINVMYLDLTGGKNSFSNQLFDKERNVVLRLKFRLRGSLADGDVCDIIIEDAVFAASDEAQSLASSKSTLKTKNGKIIIKK